MTTRKLATAFLLGLISIGLIFGIAAADEKISLKGTIKEYDTDAKTLVVTTEDGKEMTFAVENEKALKKLDDRLFKGDGVKIRYIGKDGKNIIEGPNDLKGTKPGC